MVAVVTRGNPANDRKEHARPAREEASQRIRHIVGDGSSEAQRSEQHGRTNGEEERNENEVIMEQGQGSRDHDKHRPGGHPNAPDRSEVKLNQTRAP